MAEGAIRLGPLGDRQAETLAAGVEPELRERVVGAAGGNPLFLEQLVAYAEEGGSLDAVPPSVEALIAARLDLLDAHERALLQRAALSGRLFQRAVLRELGAEILRLPGLEEKGFVRRVRDGFRFHHVLVRDVAYSSLPKAERAELHERLADWLDQQGELDELVGYHLEQAYRLGAELWTVDRRLRGLAADAGERLGTAGIEAWKRGETPATVNLLGRAAELLPELDPFRIELLCELGSALRAGGELAPAVTALVEAAEGANAAADRRLELRARLELARVRLFSDPEGRASELVDIAAEAIPVFEAVKDDRSLGRAWLALAIVHGPMHARQGAAADAAIQASDHFRRSGWPASSSIGLLAAALQNGPTPVPEAIRRCRKLLVGADPGAQASVLAPLGGLEAMRGRFDDARRLVAQARDLYGKLGQTSTAEANCGLIACQIEVLAGDPAAAELALRASYTELERVGDRAYLATVAAELADVLCDQQRDEEAEHWCLLASQLGASDDAFTQILWRATRAKLVARQGAPGEGEALARESLRLAEETDELNHKAKVLLDLAEVLRSADRAGEASEAVEAAIELFNRKGNIAAARQAKVLLDGLAIA